MQYKQLDQKNTHYMKMSAKISAFIFCIICILIRHVLPCWQLHFFWVSICLVPGPQMWLGMYKWTSRKQTQTV